MAKPIITAQRVSRDHSDNFVFQRSLLAYVEAARRVRGSVLEIGTGVGYGIEVVAPNVESYITVDKFEPDFEGRPLPRNVEFHCESVPPLPFATNSFDFVISFQVIEHIKRDFELVAEMCRVLKPGGRLIISTPNAPMSLTRNPWHVREYSVDEFCNLIGSAFDKVEAMGVFGNDRVMNYYRKNREGVERITRFDVLDLQHRLPSWMLRLPYDVLNRLNRRLLLTKNRTLTTSITMDDYFLAEASDQCFDLYFVATKRP